MSSYQYGSDPQKQGDGTPAHQPEPFIQYGTPFPNNQFTGYNTPGHPPNLGAGPQYQQPIIWPGQYGYHNAHQPVAPQSQIIPNYSQVIQQPGYIVMPSQPYQNNYVPQYPMHYHMQPLQYSQQQQITPSVSNYDGSSFVGVPQTITTQNRTQSAPQNYFSAPGQIQPILPQKQQSLDQVQLQQQITICRFQFKAQFVVDLQRDAIYISGSAAQLGKWDLKSAVKLQPLDRQGFQWQIQCELYSDSLIEYKYVIQSLRNTQPPIWETLPSNRLLNTRNKKEIRLNEVWGDGKVNEEFKTAKTSEVKTSQLAPTIVFPIQQPDGVTLRAQNNKLLIMSPPSTSFNTPRASQLFTTQNRLASASDASFINEETQHIFQVEQSSFLPQQEIIPTVDKPFVETILQKEVQSLTNTKIVTDVPGQVPYTRMRKALQQAFKDYESNQTKTVSADEDLGKTVLKPETSDAVTPPTTTVELDPNEPILHVSYMLPYRLERSSHKPSEFVAKQCYHNPTFLFGTLDYLGQQKKYNFYWVGIISTENKLTEAEETQARLVLKEKKCYPVFLTLNEIKAFLMYYESLIKPKMHNFLNLTDDSTFIHNNWSSYVSLNQKIANKVIEIRSQLPQQLRVVWVHGDHLMLVPQYLRKSFSQANLGFYFHSAFPASAVFASLYYRRELLQSLLQVDLVGFHLFEYARNFLNTCHRLFNLQLDYSNGGFMSVNYHGRIVGVRVSHIGIDEEFIQHIMQQSAFKKEVEKFQKEFKPIIEACYKSSLQSQSIWSRSSLNMAQNLQNRLQQRGAEVHLRGAETNGSTSQSTNSLRTLQEVNAPVNENKPKPVVICSIDTFTPLSGFITKLKGYQKFLQSYPSYRNKVVLIQFIPSIYCNSNISNDSQGETSHSKDYHMTDSISSLKDLWSDIERITLEIHQEFGKHCLFIDKSNPPLAKRLACWSQAQILLIATLKDGLCLPPLEFVTVKKIMNDFSNSSMILSEYAGCSNAFSGFHSYNSFDLQDICQALDSALSTTTDKKAEMMSRAYTYSSRRTFKKWVDSFLKDLKQMYNPLSTVAAKYIYLGLRTEASLLTYQKVIATPLDIEQCAAKFGKCNRCLILIDHEALPRKQFGRGEMQPTDQTIMDLAEITQDSRNTVALLSCESRNYVKKVFNRVTNLWLAAESGYEYRINGQWQTLFKISSNWWLKILKQIMQEYCDNVDGSCVEERKSTIVWNYKNAEEEHGPMCAKELYLQLKHLIGPNAPIEIVQGNGFLEVKPIQLKKTTLLSIFLKELSQVYSKVDFLLYIGADTSDEPVFEYLKQQIKSEKSQYFSPDCHTNLCILGKKPSKADFYVDEIEKLAILINKLGLETKKRKKNRSYSNLNEIATTFVQKTGGLASAGQSTNDLGKKFNSLKSLDQPLRAKTNRQKLNLETEAPIYEGHASEEESQINFAESIRSPHSISNEANTISSHNHLTSRKSQNFTLTLDNREGRVNSSNNMEVILKSTSYIELSPGDRRTKRLDSQVERLPHDISMPQLAPKDSYGLNDRQQKEAVDQQISKVLKDEQQQLMKK